MFFSLLTFFSLLFFFETLPVYAETKLAQASATLSVEDLQVKDNRAQILKAFLTRYNSPFANEANTFVQQADKNRLDWRLLVAISGVESTFGQAYPQGTYNAWGWGIYGTNMHGFTSWEDAITTISSELRARYMDKWGAKNVYQIGSFYAASPTWASRVDSFMAKMSQFENEYNSKQLSISL